MVYSADVDRILRGPVINYGQGGGLQNGREGASQVLYLQKKGGGGRRKRFYPFEGGGGAHTN